MDNFDTNAGSGRTQIYNAFDVNINARLPGGAAVFGGFVTERTLCAICDEPDDPNMLLYCVQVNGVEIPQTVTVLATPARWRDRLNANFGIFAQDIWTLNRPTLTYGGRWEYVSQQVDGQPAQSGRFANIPAFQDKKMPVWKSFSPRTGVVYDLQGNGKTALKFGFNKFMAAATTTLASLYDPADATQIQMNLQWTDKNTDDIAQGERGCAFASDPTCEINFASLPSNFGTVSLAEPDPGLTRPYVYQFNTGITREILRGVSVSFDWFHNISKNFLGRNNINRPGTLNADGTVTNASYRPVTVFSRSTGRRSRCSTSPARRWASWPRRTSTPTIRG